MAKDNSVGLKYDLELRGGEEEQEISKIFSKFFFVTFSRHGWFKTTEYTYIFLKPDDSFRESFNMYNEVLLIFFPYNEFHNRSLDLVDKTLQEFTNRLDKVCVLLVSKDNRIDDKIEKLNNENKDSRIIVPFTYSEILNFSFGKTNIDYKFRKYFYNRDLFALESPIKSEAYFFGRNHIVQTLYDKYSLGEHGGLFGLRRIGKTSVLFAVERMITLRGGNSIYIDCQNTDIHKSRWNILLYKIVKELIEKYELNDIEINQENYNECNASDSFENDLSIVKSKLNNNRILLIFDEIEHISFKTSSSEFWASGMDYLYLWQTLRSINQKNDSLFSFLIAGVNPLCLEQPLVNELDNPIFSIIKPIYLNLFTVENVEQMISSIGKYMGLQFDNEIYTFLTEDYGGHPFLIRHICSLINESIKINRPYKITKYEYKEKKKEYDLRIEDYIELILSVLKKWYPEEYELLEILASQGNEAFIISTNGNIRVIDHLFGYGILKKEREKYYITIKAIETYINNKLRLKEDMNTKEGVWKTISVKRNSLEDSLRRLVITSFITKYGKIEAKERILKVIDQTRKAKLQGMGISSLINEIYFSEIKIIILKYWDCFERLFNDKLKFEVFCDYINSNRVDAHSKTISKEDLAVLLIAFKWIEDAICDVA